MLPLASILPLIDRSLKLLFFIPAPRAVDAVQSALDVGGCSREILVLASSLQFTEAFSASTLPQQEKNSSANEQRNDELESLT